MKHPKFSLNYRILVEGPEHLYHVGLSVSVAPSVRGADEHQKISSVPRAQNVFNYCVMTHTKQFRKGRNVGSKVKTPILNHDVQ